MVIDHLGLLMHIHSSAIRGYLYHQWGIVVDYHIVHRGRGCHFLLVLATRVDCLVMVFEDIGLWHLEVTCISHEVRWVSRSWPVRWYAPLRFVPGR